MSPTEPAWLLQRELTLVWVLLIVTVIVTFFIQRYRITYIPPSGAAMVLGILVGSVMKLSGQPSVSATLASLQMHPCRAMTQHLASVLNLIGHLSVVHIEMGADDLSIIVVLQMYLPRSQTSEGLMGGIVL